ncbi:MAG: hypothetical protein ACJAVI_004289 [Candidatus Azotimanducaceae bacterium]|jgi:hypothetical protein
MKIFNVYYGVLEWLVCGLFSLACKGCSEGGEGAQKGSVSAWALTYSIGSTDDADAEIDSIAEMKGQVFSNLQAG